MALFVFVLAIVTSLHLIAFVLAIGTEHRHSHAKVVPDEYDEKTYYVNTMDALKVYRLAAFGFY